MAHSVLVVVGSTAVTARARNTSRRSLGIINDGSAIVYCTVDDATATANSGIRLAAAGTTGDRVFFDVNVPLGAVSCISALGSQVLLFEGR